MLFSKSGFTDEVVRQAKQEGKLLLVDLREMYGDNSAIS